ncbi:amylo-alpha-1,6-glucosidase [Dictyobacter kobayashii]|uniref:Mannosylglycerate hydrolase MGH1-like glycoside hydrolase domain-containing protein n=1 Tax=Dictyobacter kobayashii TaxID=2014872 RepID=A0A402AIU3_9CHLR|nr:amylo-alpha-1,6-glucosidase [Dictyobacter kobayashii]GCE19037.1 hypothetical protein KDK_28370 [Dictyobacter kobayashii]
MNRYIHMKEITEQSVSTTPSFEREVLVDFWQKALEALQSLQNPLGLMASGQDGHFHAIFGRDSLWTVQLALKAVRRLPEHELQVGGTYAAYYNWLHDLASSVLLGLAQLQGQAVNDANEEQPGRIVHEYWEPIPPKMAQAHWPVVDGNGRYYGAFDATFLFVSTAAQVDAYFNDQALLEKLWPHIHAALLWMLNWSDLDQDGLVEYARRNPGGYGLPNQVWKDSSDSVLAPDDRSLSHPVAWIEVQGYALDAYSAYLALAQKLGRLDPDLQQQIEQRMAGLRQGLASFWMQQENIPAMALDAQKQQIPMVASNAGHLLWSHAVDEQQARQISERLSNPDMLTPWGVRTLSDQAYCYDPFNYHRGTVWPFDNAIIAAGMENYGFETQARTIAQSVLQALETIDNPVELYMVLPSQVIRAPHIQQLWALVDYRQACNVQAWTAAAILYMVSLFF